MLHNTFYIIKQMRKDSVLLGAKYDNKRKK